MRKLLFLLAFVSTLAHAQYYGGYLPLKGGTVTGNLGVTGNVNVQGNVSSTVNTQPASITNSGVALTAAPNVADTQFFNSTYTTDNRIVELIFFQNCLSERFKSDSQASVATPFSVCGGFGTGITGITSNSGTGAWVHTGNLSATGTGTMPVYGATGTAVNAPHMVSSTVALASGAATVTLTGTAVFTSAATYTCTATDTTTAAAVKVTPASGTSITFAGTTTDVVAYQCVGN